MSTEEIASQISNVGTQIRTLTELATKNDGQIGALASAVGTLTEISRKHDTEITAIREDSARRSGINPQFLATVVGLLLGLLTLTGSIATNWSALVNERDACKVLLAERDQRISDLQEATAKEVAAAERITNMETLMRVAMNSSANIPRQQ